MKYLDKLKNTHFIGFPDIDWSSVFVRDSILIECEEFYDGKNIFIDIVRPFVSRDYKFIFKENEGANILIVSEQDRKSIQKQISEISELAKMDVAHIKEEKQLTFHPWLGLKILCMIPFWVFSVIKARLNMVESRSCINNLIILFLFKSLNKIVLNKYHLLISYYDSLIIESYLTALFKHNNITTCTLQHAQFNSWRENKFINSGVEFRSSCSDYYIAWNQFSLDEAKKDGCNVKNYIKAGIIGYVGTEYKECSYPNNGVFGIALAHPFFEAESLKMIEAANLLAEKRHLKYYLKLHPNYEEHYFDDKVNKTYYLGNIKKGIPMLEYANMVDFTIVGSSSVFIEMLYLRHNVIRYSTKSISDKFKDINLGSVYSKVDDVVDVYDKGFNKEEDEKLFEYLCYTKDCTKEYQRIIKKLSDDKC